MCFFGDMLYSSVVVEIVEIIYGEFINLLAFNNLYLKFQESLIIRPSSSKKKPLVLRMVVLILAMASGIYLCSICLIQIGGGGSIGKSVRIQVVKRPCEEAIDVEPSEKPYVHFPKPMTFSRYKGSYS